MPETITIRVYEELNDFLHYSRRKKAFTYAYSGKRTIKDILEGLGIPHTEIDLILANGASVDFGYTPRTGDYISAYPVFETLDISQVTRLRPEPLRVTRFITDVHLGTLARYLRMAGFDTCYRNDLSDQEIIEISLQERRIILTRDLALLKNGKVTHGSFVRSTKPAVQLKEIIGRFGIEQLMSPFSRCTECNGILEQVPSEAVAGRIKANALLFFSEFWQCRSCRKVYWRGSHYQNMLKLLEGLRKT